MGCVSKDFYKRVEFIYAMISLEIFISCRNDNTIDKAREAYIGLGRVSGTISPTERTQGKRKSHSMFDELQYKVLV